MKSLSCVKTLVVVAASLAMLQGALAESRQVQHSVSDPVVVQNPVVPRDGILDIKLQEKWRSGGPHSDQTFRFVAAVHAGGDGRTYVLDLVQSFVEVFDPDGQPVGQLSSEGEGPGQSRQPGGILIDADGNLGLVQGFPGKLVLVGMDNSPQGNLFFKKKPTAGGYMIMAFGMCVNENLVLGGIDVVERNGLDRRVQFVGSFDSTGQELVRYVDKPRRFESGRMMLNEAEDFFIAAEHYALDPGGRLFAAIDRNCYKVTAYGLQGNAELVVEREFTSRQRSDVEMAEVRDNFTYQASCYPRGADFRAEETVPDIHSLHVDREGKLWVRHSYSDQDLPAGTIMKLDVFSNDGVYIHDAHLQGQGDPNADGWFFLGNDQVVRVIDLRSAYNAIHRPDRVDPLAEPITLEIVCYDMVVGQ